MSNVAEAFGSDEKIGVEILMGLLAEASAGRDVSSAVPQIISVRASWDLADSERS
jgi:hypothetical protein